PAGRAAGAASGDSTRAAAVGAPNEPVVGTPFDSWNAVTAASVSGPNRPPPAATSSASRKPRYARYHWSSATSSLTVWGSGPAEGTKPCSPIVRSAARATAPAGSAAYPRRRGQQ